jgi:hypothetical protein
MKNCTLPCIFKVVLLAVCHLSAQAAPPLLEWSASAGGNRYTESKMQLHGPELGLRVKANHFAQSMNLFGEGELFVGQQNYSSDGTGTMRGVTNVESRWRGLSRVVPGLTPTEGLYTGLALHTLWNDLRGLSSTGNPGYEREAVQLWLPLRWVSNQAWQMETGLLLRGRHMSRLSQSSRSYQDVSNPQRHGVYAQVSWDYQVDTDNLVSPYLRYTSLASSDYVIMNHQYWYEPASKRWQMGLTWHWDHTP